jgi:hypothetical protein
MKTLTALLISLPLICTPLAANADKGGNKGPNERAWEHANDNARFKRDYNDRYEHHDKWKREESHRDRYYGDRDDRYRDRDRGSRDPNRDRDYRYGDRDYRYGDRDSRYGDRDYRYGNRDSSDPNREQYRSRERNRDYTDTRGNTGGGESQ